MRVICIDSTPPSGMPKSPLKESKTYTIVEVVPTGIFGNDGDCYIMAETEKWQRINLIAFNKSRFIPLSEKDENENVEEETIPFKKRELQNTLII